jgi:MFS family permease
MNDERKLNIKAIIIGWLVDTVGSFVAGIFIGIAAGIILVTKGISPEHIAEELSSSKSFRNISLFVGFSFTFIGGYIAAFIAKADELKHALIVGILSLIISVLFFSITQTTEPNWQLISLFVIPFALLGGYLRKITKKQLIDKKES